MLKKYKYREKVMATAELVPNHPVKNGVKMQAHHLVSAKGVDIAGLSKKLEHLGYNINDIDNLVLIPSTLQGACHLHVQLHRGNHTAEDKDGDSSDDDKHPKSYHFAVKKLLDGIKDDLKDGDLCKDSKRSVQKQVNRLSKKLIRKINNFKLPLTSIHRNFKGGASGCRCADSIATALASRKNCSVDRDHEKRSGRRAQALGQRKYDIHVKKQKYTLKIGR